MADKNCSEKYSLSFTSIGVRRLETVEVARAYVEKSDWKEIRRLIVEDNLIALNAEGTRKRIGSEIIKRLRTLDDAEIAFLSDSVDADQLAMLWVAICRTYPILRNFSKNVLSARFASMIPDVPKTAWSAFVEEEELDHPELARITDKSRKQLELRAFGMLRECRLIDKDCNITPLYPSARFASLLRERSPRDFELFPKVGVFL